MYAYGSDIVKQTGSCLLAVLAHHLTEESEIYTSFAKY